MLYSFSSNWSYRRLLEDFGDGGGSSWLLLTHGLTRHGYSKGIVGGQSFQFIRKLRDLAAYLSVRDVILATLEVVPPHYFGNSYVVVPLPLIEADLAQQLFLMMLELPHDFDWAWLFADGGHSRTHQNRKPFHLRRLRTDSTRDVLSWGLEQLKLSSMGR